MKYLNNFLINGSRIGVNRSSDFSFRLSAVADKSEKDESTKPTLLRLARNASSSLKVAKLGKRFLRYNKANFSADRNFTSLPNKLVIPLSTSV